MWFVLSDELFSLRGQMEKQIPTKRPSFPTPCTAATLEKEVGAEQKPVCGQLFR